MASEQKPSTIRKSSAKSRPGSRTSQPRSRPNTGSKRLDSAGSATGRMPSGYGARKASFSVTRQTSNPAHISTVGFYEKVKQVLTKPSRNRMVYELHNLESWFKKKSKLFGKLKRDVLLDVIKHCEFQTVPADSVIIQQGYKMKQQNFYIIVRGRVSTMVKEEAMDEKEEEEDADESRDQKAGYDSDRESVESIPPMETDRTKLGSVINTKGDGETFGELSLYSGDHDRTASIVADEVTDLVIISKELYERSVAKLVGQEYEHNQRFVNHNKLFREWSIKQRRHLSLIIHRQKFAYDEVITKQGEVANYLYFIHSGEVKVVVDPDLHTEHFPAFISKTGSCIADESFKPNIHFGLQNFWSQKSRQARMLNHATEEVMKDGKIQSKDLQENKLILSPSAVRKQVAMTKAKMHRKYNVCYLEAGHLLGDVELLMGLDRYHATTVSTSQETIVYKLHRVQFNRYFVKRNPETVSAMTTNLGMQMPRRIDREHIKKHVPLLQCIMVCLDEMNGTNFIKKKPKVDEADLEILAEHDNISNVRPRTKSGISSKSFPLSGKQKEESELLRHSSLGFGLPEASQQAMLKYLNTQVNLTLNTDTVSEAVTDTGDPEKMDEEEEGEGEGGDNRESTRLKQQAGVDGVYTMAKNEKPVKENKRERPINPRHGIFFKVIQVSNPHIDKNLLAIEEEEFNYLCQVKRRIAKQLHNFYPFASLESFLHLGDAHEPKTGRMCRRAVATAGADQAAMLKRTELANLPRKTALKSSRVTQSANGIEKNGRKNVGFTLPNK